MLFRSHPLVTRYLKGVFNTRPSFPRYKQVWDVTIVLKFLKSLDPLDSLSLKDLTLKTTMLLALLSGQRCQTLRAIKIDSMVLDDDKCTFKIFELLKTSKPGRHFGHLEFLAFKDDEKLCVVTVIKEYVKQTMTLRQKHTQLLISYQKPHNPVSTETIGKWLKAVLQKSGIDINVFGAHSTRAASTSAAKAANVPIGLIMDAAGWTTASTFGKFYDKPITKDTAVNYGETLLKATKENLD